YYVNSPGEEQSPARVVRPRCLPVRSPPARSGPPPRPLGPLPPRVVRMRESGYPGKGGRSLSAARTRSTAMHSKHPDVPWLDAAFIENQRNFPAVQLMRYARRHIAWSWDGTRILDSAGDEAELYQRLKAAGIDTNRVVFDYVDPL